MRVLSEEGFEELTISRVAEAVDVVPGALYRYFSSKDALLAAMQRRLIGDMHERFTADRGAWRASAASLSEHARVLFELLAGARFYCDLSRTRPEQFRLLSVLLGDPRNLIPDEEAEVTAPSLIAFLADVRALFREARVCGALTSGADMDRTLVFWSSLQGAMQLSKLRRYENSMFDGAKLGEMAARTLLVGWGADHVDLDCAERHLATHLNPSSKEQKS